jgi:hypothetical protein
MPIVAAPSLNLSYIGQGPTAGGQIIFDQTSGPKAKTLYAYGVATNGNTTTGANAAPVGFIDGVQSLGKTLVLNLYGCGAPGTAPDGTANCSPYYTVQGATQVLVGDTVTVAGFSNSNNNISTAAAVHGVQSGVIWVANSNYASAGAETNPAATMTDLQKSVPIWVDVFIAGSNSDTPAVLVAAGSLIPSTITSTGFILNWTALATTAQTIHFGAIIAFSA